MRDKESDKGDERERYKGDERERDERQGKR